ncbi:MAG TPA: extracellular solute-binding protein, partial [Fimbriimonadaceae bacterium]|nr:extracellular solute-binding protein [Fimbriimonadaceae bacterium]
WNWGWSYVFGGRLWDGQGKITITEPEAVRAYEWIAGYSKRYGPGELQTFRSGFGNFSSPQNAFMDRKVAMVLQGVWMYNFINMYQPELRWAAAPFPHPADRPDLAELTFADMDILVIPRGARHPKEAFEFIAYVQSQKAMEKLCLLQRKNSPLREVSQEFWDAHPNPYIRLFDRLSYSKNAVPPPKIGIWPEFQAELNNAFDNVMLLKLTPNEALSNVEARMQPKMDQYLARLKAREGRAR